MYDAVENYSRRPNSHVVTKYLKKIKVRLFVKFREMYRKDHLCSRMNLSAYVSENDLTGNEKDTNMSANKHIETNSEMSSLDSSRQTDS